MRPVAAAIVAVALILFHFPALAEPIDYYRAPGAYYDPAIPTPDEFFGHGLGDKPVRHDMMVAYMRALARQSPRIAAETVGFSHEGRPILFLTITAPENHERLDDIRAAHIARLAPDAPDTDGPAVVWLHYGVHGAESSGMDAAIPTLYHLAAAQGEAIEETLRDTVVLMVAIFNPDGHSRRVNHVYTFLSETPVTDPAHAQHNLWIEARTNHYWFDLNRDWMLQTQPESQSWIGKWHEWKPNVVGDFHEMGSNSTYYFHPGEPRRVNPLIPERARELASAFAEEYRGRLDAAGELYASEEGFDNFYVGKGSTYPQVNGAVGILFEAAAARGGRIDTDNGLRTYAQNIRIHFNMSLSTIEGARRHRAALRAYQRAFFAGAPREARAHPVKAYVFTTAGDEARLDHFLKLLARHDVAAYRLARDVAAGGRDFRAGASVVVPLDQPQHRFIRALFDRVTEFEENVFYDVSGWTMPLAYDLDYAPLDGMRYNASLLGERARGAGYAKPAPGEARYGYIFDWEDYYAPRALHRFLSEDVIARVLAAPKTLAIDGAPREFRRGAIFVPFAGQTVSRERIAQIAARVAREDGVDIFPLDSGNAAPGVGDLGASRSVRSLKKPKILLLFDDGVSRYSAGQIWHLLDWRMKIPVVMRRKNDLGGLKLSDYTHIILPGGRGARLDDKDAETVKTWVRAGGVLIATADAAVWAQGAFLADAAREKPAEEIPAGEERLDYAEKTVKDAEHVIGGALFESDLDITHPLGFGYADRAIATMKTGAHVLATPKNPYATVARYTQAPLLSGYASERRVGEIAGTPMLAADRLGAGAIVLFTDDTSFRATFLGADKLFMNAVFFAPIVEAAGAAGAAAH
ncbi:M14 family zinc carboxypeptidase [Amphiplicatus metriothermophilus]|uniref:Zinc carboxypeptidase n=1 Tax=Amphiplicatus metriothermophilus TaxID=1519374 RepID=A0A239PKP0_9PROT|nr:M14 family zinc carboxypeptidase [Amphiplicatus metriothermophilus]MBB5517283.1 hypothetical protein [Amphiplicatus metriothermophilus]SNT68381.1 Zinc carboxypeptidase [Amphiplicatus metriothermophilus]